MQPFTATDECFPSTDLISPWPSQPCPGSLVTCQGIGLLSTHPWAQIDLAGWSPCACTLSGRTKRLVVQAEPGHVGKYAHSSRVYQRSPPMEAQVTRMPGFPLCGTGKRGSGGRCHKTTESQPEAASQPLQPAKPLLGMTLALRGAQGARRGSVALELSPQPPSPGHRAWPHGTGPSPFLGDASPALSRVPPIPQS